MIITIAGFKGGVGKSTTAVHLAAYLSGHNTTVLVDGDVLRSASNWATRGRLPFKVVGEGQLPNAVRQHEHVVIDTQARPAAEDLEDLAEGCDLLVIPTTPDALSLEGVFMTMRALDRLGGRASYKTLLTNVPPHPSKEGAEARYLIQEEEIPLFEGQISRLVAFRKAALSGLPVYEVTDKQAKRGWEEYQTIGEEVLQKP